MVGCLGGASYQRRCAGKCQSGQKHPHQIAVVASAPGQGQRLAFRYRSWKVSFELVLQDELGLNRSYISAARESQCIVSVLKKRRRGRKAWYITALKERCRSTEGVHIMGSRRA